MYKYANALQHTATHYTATHCNTLQHTATHCDTVTPSNTLHRNIQGLHPRAHSKNPHTLIQQHNAPHCNTLQHAATRCNALQRTTTHCNTAISNTSRTPYPATHYTILQHTLQHTTAQEHRTSHAALIHVRQTSTMPMAHLRKMPSTIRARMSSSPPYTYTYTYTYALSSTSTIYQDSKILSRINKSSHRTLIDKPHLGKMLYQTAHENNENKHTYSILY